ncbi:hypothetical protein AAFF_G00351850 [Aldrovandia affinis]|uniref:PH domain-containing protein n=1 Tax=Aldrovandia affinis TaxID=143900 RepID=A0AAD7SJH8_9TELE|nr:hypothetical protein AAFF_G00351850 [Aldrovandia affinis]
MEGVLYKWTNYINGWQPRWFVLGSGILSYYDSQDDVCTGSKGSIKMSVCEIKVHPTDNTRLELIIPGEQHFYVKAVNAAERQKWLVVLGSSKACLIDTRTKKEQDITETTETLKTKMSELRLYCDLLMQQVHTIQKSVDEEEEEEEADHTTSSTETISDASSLLSATCNTFIKTLEECMKIANANFKPEMFLSNAPTSVIAPISSSPMHMVRMKRSTSNPGTYAFEGHSPMESLSTLQRFSQRRARNYSDTESNSDGCPEETDRNVLCSKVLANGDSTSTIPEETSASTRI